MKPVVTMDGKSSYTFEQPESTKVTSKRRLVIVVSVVTVVGVIVIAGVTLGSFFLGHQSGKDGYKEAWLTYTSGENNDQTIKERVIVQKQESKIIRPGVMSLVIDYKKNMLVIRYDNELNGNENLYCYVYDFEPGMYGTIEKDEFAVSSAQGNLTTQCKNNEVTQLERTGERVPETELSPLAEQMCFGAEILRVHRVGGTRRRTNMSTLTLIND